MDPHPLVPDVRPVTGPRALAAETPSGATGWEITFLDALADEAAGNLELLLTLERG